jgi:hypothetical protein
MPEALMNGGTYKVYPDNCRIACEQLEHVVRQPH